VLNELELQGWGAAARARQRFGGRRLAGADGTTPLLGTDPLHPRMASHPRVDGASGGHVFGDHQV